MNSQRHHVVGRSSLLFLKFVICDNNKTIIIKLCYNCINTFYVDKLTIYVDKLIWAHTLRKTYIDYVIRVIFTKYVDKRKVY